MKPNVKIVDWIDLGTYLMGYVEDHPNFEKGTFVHTSVIIERHNDGMIETNNTFYYPIGDGIKYDPKADNLFVEIKHESP